MPSEPLQKQTVVFVDGQNLFHSSREAFGHVYPNSNISALAGRVCGKQGWELKQVRFYTGIPDRSDDPFWSHFWVYAGGPTLEACLVSGSDIVSES